MTQTPDMRRTGSRRQQLELPKGLSMQSLQKRPSIAPVPAMVDANDISIQLGDQDTGSEDSLLFIDDDEDPG